MDELLEAIMRAAAMDMELNKKEKSDSKKYAMDIAKLNRELYDAHIKQGFTKEESLELVKTVIMTGGK